MKLDREFLTSPGGQAALLCVLAVLALLGARWWRTRRPALPAAKTVAVAALPKTFVREGARFPKITPPAPTPPTVSPARAVEAPQAAEKARSSPLNIWTVERPAAALTKITAPYGRLIPCETVFALESNRLESPVIGLVTEDVWHDGRLIVPAGAEVHGKAALDRTRERIAANGSWHITWRTPNTDNGTDLTVTGLALDRDVNAERNTFGERDGSAGLRGTIVKTQDDRELKLFAATFLATATAAMQDVRSSAGLLGEAALPAATVRNATLAGTGTVLREYAQSMREAIARDGFFVRVPAGKPFYLYVTETINRSPSRETRSPAASLP